MADEAIMSITWANILRVMGNVNRTMGWPQATLNRRAFSQKGLKRPSCAELYLLSRTAPPEILSCYGQSGWAQESSPEWTLKPAKQGSSFWAGTQVQNDKSREVLAR